MLVIGTELSEDVDHPGLCRTDLVDSIRLGKYHTHLFYTLNIYKVNIFIY